MLREVIHYRVPEVSGKSTNVEEGYDSMPKFIPDYDDYS